MSQILIISHENAIRSQILEAYLQEHLGPKDRVYSGGWEPSGVDPQAIRVMAEDRVVIAGQTSDHFEEFKDYPIEKLILLDPRAENLLNGKFPKASLESIPLEEIDGFSGPERMDQVRELRDRLKTLALELAQKITS